MHDNALITLMLNEQNYSDLRRIESLYNQTLQGLRTVNQISEMLLTQDTAGVYELEKDIYDRQKTPVMPEFENITYPNDNFYVLNYWDEEGIGRPIEDGIMDCHKAFVQNVTSYIEFMYQIPSNALDIWHTLCDQYTKETRLKSIREKYGFSINEMTFKLSDILKNISQSVRIQEASSNA